MQNVNLENVVDTLADKIGLAATQIQPIAEETLRQFQMRAIVGVIVGCVLGLLLIFPGIFCIKKALYYNKEAEEEISFAFTVGSVLILFAAVMSTCIGLGSIGDAIAPLPGMLGL